MRFEDLEVWKKAARLGVELYRYAPRLKDFGFRDQLTRAGLSISSNIAEGCEREPGRDCIRFLVYAKGSCGEVRSQLYLGRQAGFIDAATADKLIDETRRIARMLRSLITRLRAPKEASAAPGE